MTNLEKYNQAFVGCLSVDPALLNTLRYQDVAAWDSVGHMRLMADLEGAFNIMLNAEDIVDFSSYEKGKLILRQYGIEL